MILSAMAMRTSDSRLWTLAPAEVPMAWSFGMASNELAELIDDGDGGKIAFALGIAPGKEAMSAENDAIAAGSFLDDPAEHHAKLEAGALPGKPRRAYGCTPG